MTSAVIYFDGGTSVSQAPQASNRIASISWGIVAHANDTTHEINGLVTRPAPIVSTKYHELVAFVESVLWASHNRYGPNDCSFYTDDQLLHQSQFFLHDQQSKVSRTQRVSLTTQLRFVVDEFYGSMSGLMNILMLYLSEARIMKVKGHADCVYNCRADYLVRQARQKSSTILPFNSWLSGFLAQGGISPTGGVINQTRIGSSFLHQSVDLIPN